MSYSPIEDRYLATLTQQQFPDMPPAEPSIDGMQLAMGGNAAGRHSDRPMSDIPMALLDMGAATAKGAVQGFVGLPGDLEGIGRLVLDKMGFGVDQSTTLPKTEDVKAWLDKNIGQVGNGQNPYESIGEVVAPGGQIKATKAVAKGAVEAGKALAPKAAEMVIDSMAKLGSPVKIDLMAYHGSPHQVDKFDSKKIGSGEGAQAYGYGLYFAEDKGVAQGYHTSLSMKVAHVDGQVPERGSLEWEAANSIASKGYDEALAQAEKTADFKFITPEGRDRYKQLVDVIKGMKDKKVVDKASGGVYTVDIPDEMASKMLDFDKPIGEQSPEIQALAKKLKLSDSDLGGDLLAAARGKTPKGAKMMRDAGISGVRYLDQGSRGSDKGAQNIVVFPGGEDQIKILKQEGN